jgi:succinate dehydrogenase/fumarate reductase flavoprotein subunit
VVSNPHRIDLNAVREKRVVFRKPAEKKSGHDPDDLVREIQKILFPVDVLIIMKEAKLRNALEKMIKLKEEKLPGIVARDTRTLIKARETEAMVLSAEMTLRASLMRKETRENLFYREDYPNPDNENWLKWILVEKGEKGDMIFSTEEVPFQKSKFRPYPPSAAL